MGKVKTAFFIAKEEVYNTTCSSTKNLNRKALNNWSVCFKEREKGTAAGVTIGRCRHFDCSIKACQSKEMAKFKKIFFDVKANVFIE